MVGRDEEVTAMIVTSDVGEKKEMSTVWAEHVEFARSPQALSACIVGLHVGCA